MPKHFGRNCFGRNNGRKSCGRTLSGIVSYPILCKDEFNWDFNYIKNSQLFGHIYSDGFVIKWWYLRGATQNKRCQQNVTDNDRDSRALTGGPLWRGPRRAAKGWVRLQSNQLNSICTVGIGYYDYHLMTNIENNDYFPDSRFKMPFYYIRNIA